MENKMENYRVRIHRFILKFVKDPALAEDLTQDVLLKIWIGREKISCLEDMDSYVLTMSKNHVMDHFKKLAKERSYQEEVWYLLQDSENRVESNLVTKDIEARLDAILKALPTRQQQIFELNHNKGLTLKEIAEKLNIAPNTVKNHLTRALKVVRSQMKPESFLLVIWIYLIWG
jgi:RNA polymerase sigma-70 factor (ECF subfamily)